MRATLRMGVEMIPSDRFTSAGDRARRLSTVVAEVRTTLGRGLVSRLVRAGLAVLILAALVVAYESVNFFFYFTVLSNILLIAVLAGEAINPGWMDTNGVLRGASTLYIGDRLGLCRFAPSHRGRCRIDGRMDQLRSPLSGPGGRHDRLAALFSGSEVGAQSRFGCGSSFRLCF
jgi:hypothetical protein